jgi:hypothetical protein
MNYNSFKGRDLYLKSKPHLNKPFSEIMAFYKTPLENDEVSNIVYPIIDSNGDAFTSYRDSLIGLKLQCIAIVSDGNTTTFLKLQNEKIGTVYFDAAFAESEFATDEELQKEKQAAIDENKEIDSNKRKSEKEISDYNNIIANPCLQVDGDYDEFHYEYKYSTGYIKPKDPTIENDYPKPSEYYDAIFYKNKSKTNSIYYLNLMGEAPNALAAEQGVIIILKNKKRLNKPLAIIKTEVNERGDNGESFIRNSFIKLTQQDIQLLKSSPIDSFELYDTQVSELDYKVLYQMFLCILNK